MTAAVEIYDTTLRDGSQRAGISYSVADKLRIARALDALGVTFVEAGWPGSNPKDAELFDRLRREPLARATLCAFGATRRVDRTCADDPSLVALVDAATPVCTIFGKSLRFQAGEILGASAEANLQMIAEAVAFLPLARSQNFRKKSECR